MRRALVGVLLLVAACGGGGSTEEASTATTRADVVASVSTTPSKGVEEVTPTVPASSGTATTATTVAAAASPSEAAGPAALAPGTYRYRQTGSATAGTQTYESPPEGTMIAEAAGGDGTQLLQRYVDPNGEPSDVLMQFRADGMFMRETVLRQGGQEITCTFGDGVPSPSWPPKVGATANGHGTCSSFDLVVDISSVITGTKPVTVDGSAYTAFVIESTVKTSGQLTSETKQVDWFVAELRLATHTESTSSGKFGTFDFRSHGTSDLVSAKPE